MTTLTNGSMTNTNISGVGQNPQNITGDVFVTNATLDPDHSVGVLNNQSDRFTVRINASYLETPDPSATGLAPGDKLDLEITSKTGGTTKVLLTMPQQLAGKSTGDPVAL
ncbi:MAG: hypothetical protein ABEJ28_04065 [Salinigranum sp.]